VSLLKEIVHLDGEATLSIVRKRLAGDAPTRGALLLLHGFGQNRYAWHLSGRSFVNFLAGAGWDVFNLDLRGHGRSRARGSLPANALDVYIRSDLPDAVGAVRTLSGHARVSLLGHSLGGLVSYAAAATLTDELAGIVTLGAPYDFGRGNRALLEIVRGLTLATTWAERSARIPMRFVQGWFLRHRALWDLPGVPLPARAWHPRSFEPALLDEYLRLAFDRATLGELAHVTASGTAGRFVSVDGETDYARAWASADVPTLIIAGTRDLLAPVDSVRPAYEQSSARDLTYHELPLGHADLILGREAPKLTWPLVESWLSRRCAKVIG
jgi:polyhydroxyalkanoate synthase subunit PhaC